MLPMLPNILRNLFSGAATRVAPDTERQKRLDAYRGDLDTDIDACIFCGACARVCPSRAITVDVKQTTFECDPFACVYCGVCTEACPTAALTMQHGHRQVADHKSLTVLRGEKKSKEQIIALRARGKELKGGGGGDE